MLFVPHDPTACVPVHLPSSVVVLAACSVLNPYDAFFVVPILRGVCYVCNAPARVAIHDVDLRHCDDAIVELCEACVLSAAATCAMRNTF